MEMFERVQRALVVAAMACAVTLILGGMASKSTGWTWSADGTGRGWTDGVKPWAVWTFLGGLALLGLLIAGWRWTRWAWVTASPLCLVLWYAGAEAATYRTGMEAGWFATFDERTVSFGLRVTPVVGTVGAMVVAGLAVTTLGTILGRRATNRVEIASISR